MWKPGAVLAITSGILTSNCTPETSLIPVDPDADSVQFSVPSDSVQQSPSLDFAVGSLLLDVGESAVVVVTLTNALGFPVPTGQLTWLSSSNSVATVSQDGMVTGIAEGETEIFAIAGPDGIAGRLPVTVQDTTTPLPPPPIGDGEPVFGDDPSDVIVIRDDFEYATSDAIRFDGGGPWRTGNTPVEQIRLEPNDGLLGSRAVRLDIPAGFEGPFMTQPISGLPSHIFVSYWFRITPEVDPRGAKWIILNHDGVPDQPCSRGSLSRYQFEFAANQNDFGESSEVARFRGVPVLEEIPACDGPVISAGPQRGFFVWGGDPQVAAPVLSQDPLIDQVPWTPANDGGWHRHTIEIRAGDAPNGYWRLWFDGHLYWDSRGMNMNLPGRIRDFRFEMEAGTQHPQYQAWFDDLVIWRR